MVEHHNLWSRSSQQTLLGLNEKFYSLTYPFIFVQLKGNKLNVVLEKLNLKAFLSDMADRSLSRLDMLNKTSLVKLCKERNLPISGTKEVLKNYLKDWMKKNGVSSLVST